MYLPSLQFDITEVTFLHTHSLLQLEKNSSKKISSKREKVRKSKKERENMFSSDVLEIGIENIRNGFFVFLQKEENIIV